MATKQAQGSTANSGLWGWSRAKQKRKKMSGTKGNNNGRPASLRTYCPYCPDNAAKPEMKSHVSINKKTKYARGKCNHEWIVGGDSFAGTREQL